MNIKRVTARAVSAAAVLAIAAAASGCDLITPTERFNTSCGIAVDGSGSADRNGFDALNEVNSTVVPFLKEAQCRYVAFAPIADTSESVKCSQATRDIDPDLPRANDDRGALRVRERANVQKAVTELFQCIRATNPPGTDVIGGLRVLATNRPKADGTYRLLVISDFIETKQVALNKDDLSTPEKRAAVMRRLEKRIPDLGGADVATAGFGKLFSNNPVKMTEFTAFWTELMRTRAKCSAFHPYGTDAPKAAAS